MLAPRLRTATLVMTTVVAVALPACAGDGEGASPSTETATTAPGATGSPAPAPTRVVALEAEGFSLEVPGGWKDVAIDANTLQRLHEEGDTNVDEALTNHVRTLAGRGGKLLAYDESKRTTFLNVLKLASAPGVTPEQMAEGLSDQLGQAGLSDVKVEIVTVAAGPAVKATGSKEVSGRNLLQLQYYVLSGDNLFVCTLATDDPSRDQATLETIAQSFNVV